MRNLNPEDVVGLSSTAGQSDLATVTWSDYPVEKLHLRFSPSLEPLRVGEHVWWAFDLKNLGSQPIEVTFASGKRADVVLLQDGVEKYRWSSGRLFTQAIEKISLLPGMSWSTTLSDEVKVAPGTYDLVATITGSVAAGAPLPELRATIVVR